MCVATYFSSRVWHLFVFVYQAWALCAVIFAFLSVNSIQVKASGGGGRAKVGESMMSDEFIYLSELLPPFVAYVRVRVSQQSFKSYLLEDFKNVGIW